jgi:hypothetical protein
MKTSVWIKTVYEKNNIFSVFPCYVQDVFQISSEYMAIVRIQQRNVFEHEKYNMHLAAPLAKTRPAIVEAMPDSFFFMSSGQGDA